MPRVYLCDQCHEVIDEDKDKYVAYKEGTVYETHLHAKCVAQFRKDHPDAFAD